MSKYTQYAVKREGEKWAVTQFDGLCELQEGLLLDADGDQIVFGSDDYEHAYDGVTLEIAEEMAKSVVDVIATYMNSLSLHLIDCDDADDVRYAAYYAPCDKKFVPVCIQDFDVPDYYAENFARSDVDDELAFWRVEWQNKEVDGDKLAEDLCTAVCKVLNKYDIKPTE